ncbi:PD-(D/E)XK nuclease superfamily protein [Nostoc sp. MS1]|uniref:PD-(D/E)XK nuclease superfamily protein n=1 Tax=Nostoc sp. MS1 TaxID=2764711 RepID=UPI001CC6227F|nr:PD-(D/E)XK nuclease superfamily protein [Nostoc sp. MS1]BCL35255.1 4-diphosphocytidyl-2C-methyl-D-erythritol kinase [Nostoc sp. MS1]
MTQGGRAVTSGNVLENTVEGALLGHRYIQVGANLPKKQRLGCLVSSNTVLKQYAKQVYIGKGIYGSDIYVDFYIMGVPSLPSGLIIECKWQQTSGSVDEKLPYLNLNIDNCYPTQAIVLIDGGGMKPQAISWLKTQVGLNTNLLAVQDLKSFFIWANNNL